MAANVQEDPHCISPQLFLYLTPARQKPMATQITVEVTIEAPLAKAWERFTQAEHVTQWNFAAPEWHCPTAVNDLRPGGKFNYHMAAKDGSFGFDFEGTYDEVETEKKIAYTMPDGRKTIVLFAANGNQTTVTETFDAETMNSVELQQNGWQAILNNFKAHAEQG